MYEAARDRRDAGTVSVNISLLPGGSRAAFVDEFERSLPVPPPVPRGGSTAEFVEVALKSGIFLGL